MTNFAEIQKRRANLYHGKVAHDLDWLLSRLIKAEARAMKVEYSIMPCEHFSMAQCRHSWIPADWEREAEKELKGET